MLTTSQKGFTLIELMIVVAILGILSAIAIPAYQNYSIRAQVTEGLSLSGGWKTAITEFYATNGAWPSQSDLSGTVQAGGNYASNVTVNTGVIQITYGGSAHLAIAGATLTLVPYTNDNGDILWQCGWAAPPAASTLASGAIAGGTTLAPQYLPSSCNS